jgi:hypothetical protein
MTRIHHDLVSVEDFLDYLEQSGVTGATVVVLGPSTFLVRWLP